MGTTTTAAATATVAVAATAATTAATSTATTAATNPTTTTTTIRCSSYICSTTLCKRQLSPAGELELLYRSRLIGTATNNKFNLSALTIVFPLLTHVAATVKRSSSISYGKLSDKRAHIIELL